MYCKNKQCGKCGSHFLQEFTYAHLCSVCGFFKDKPTRKIEVGFDDRGQRVYKNFPIEDSY